MATNPSRITSANRVAVWLAWTPAVFPAGLVAPGTGWWEVGLTTPDSLKFKTSPEFYKTKSHQSDYTTRVIQTEDAAGVEVDLQEWSGPNFQAAFGGGDIVEVPGPPPYFKYTPPGIGGRDEVAVLIDVFDGPKRYRFNCFRAAQTEGVELGLAKGKEAVLPLRLEILGGDALDPWDLITSDPAFDPAP